MTTAALVPADLRKQLAQSDADLDAAVLGRAQKSLRLFYNTIITDATFRIEGSYVPAEHVGEWCDRLQANDYTATVAPRKHLKSTTLYAFVLWKLKNIESLPGRYPEILYISYNKTLAARHIANIKRYVKNSPYFEEFKDLKKNAEGVIRYLHKPSGKIFSVTPAGILAFKRGIHTIGIICDDILQDPQAAKMNIEQVEKVTTFFMEQVVSIVKEGGFLHVWGTPQDKKDLFFRLQGKKKFNWKKYQAIIDFKKKTVLWPELFTYARLIYIRDEEIGEKAFNKEYQAAPVRQEDMYFKPEQIADLKTTNKNMEPGKYQPQNIVVAGMDIGKHQHPSHIVVWERIARWKWKQLVSRYLEKVDYTRQVDICETYIKGFGIFKFPFDNTRGEFETFVEQKTLPPEMEPVIFTGKNQNGYATAFEKMVNKKGLEFTDDERQEEQILSVDNDLDANSTASGHGDAYWSNALAAQKMHEIDAAGEDIEKMARDSDGMPNSQAAGHVRDGEEEEEDGDDE